jgi:hypothetical protein
MGISAVLKRETGDMLRDLEDPAGGTFDAAGDFDRVLPDGDTSFTLLRYIDRCGDTVFNRLQMSDLLADIARLALMELTPGRASRSRPAPRNGGAMPR